MSSPLRFSMNMEYKCNCDVYGTVLWRTLRTEVLDTKQIISRCQTSSGENRSACVVNIRAKLWGHTNFSLTFWYDRITSGKQWTHSKLFRHEFNNLYLFYLILKSILFYLNNQVFKHLFKLLRIEKTYFFS